MLILSPNKNDFSAPFGGARLSCDQIYQAAQYFEKKKKIRIYVQTYMPGYPLGTENSCFMDVVQIQREIGDNQYAGYLHTEGAHGDKGPHVECLVVTKHKVIKPITWNVDHGVLYVNYFKNAASTDLHALAGEWLIPQSDSYTCASLSLVYLKQLLKEDAAQLKEFGFIFPYKDSYNINLYYFFVPPPQVLRYSQSSAYNQFIKAMVMEDEPGFFLHNNKTISYSPVKHLLMTVQRKENVQSDLFKETEDLLEQLPAFRKRWLEEYEKMENNRFLINKNGLNRGLAYTSRRMRKIALIEQEHKQNPGLTLLKDITEKNENSLLDDDELLASFVNVLSTVTFQKSYQIAYFLNKLSELVYIEKAVPFVFSDKANLALIKKSAEYRDCLFFMNAVQRQALNHYFKQPQQFSRLKIPCHGVLNILGWLCALAIPDEEKISFLDTIMSREEFTRSLFGFLLGYQTNYLDDYFANKQVLATFLMDYIGKDYVVAKLSQIMGNLSHLKIMFGSQSDFYDFIDEHLPIHQALSFLKGSQFFNLGLHDYLSCLDPDKRSPILLKELNDFSSDLFQGLSVKTQEPRWIFEYLLKYCDETEIINYLTTHRSFLLKSMMKIESIYPFNINKKLQDIVSEISFFSCEDSETCDLYQATFLSHKNTGLLISILKLLPSVARRDFLERIFGPQEDDCKLLPHLSAKQIKELLPTRPEPNQKQSDDEVKENETDLLLSAQIEEKGAERAASERTKSEKNIVNSGNVEDRVLSDQSSEQSVKDEEKQEALNFEPDLIENILSSPQEGDSQGNIQFFSSQSPEGEEHIEPGNTLDPDLKKQRQEFAELLEPLLKKIKQLKEMAKNDFSYERVAKAAGALKCALKNAGNDFFSGVISQVEFKDTCTNAIRIAEEEFKQHRGVWYQIHPFLRGILGLIATITVIPAIVVVFGTSQGYVNTFFCTPKSNAHEELERFEENLNTFYQQ